MKRSILLSLSVLVIYSFSQAQLWTYSYPENIVNSNDAVVKRSNKYQVTVSQGNVTKDCYVMYDKNQAESINNNLAKNPDNHWTNFSVEGAVTVRVKRLDGKGLTKADVFPKKKGYTASISGSVATINIPANVGALQLNVEMNGLADDPLFLFIDPKEMDVPTLNGNDVTIIRTSDNISTVRSKLNSATTYKYFEPGIHKWGTKTGSGYDGYKLPIKAGKKIYLPGGTYVIGSFQGDNQSNWKVYGRGIISGAGLDILPTATYIPWSAIHHSGGGKNIDIEGIVSMCPPHFALTIRGECAIDNVKMMSWWYSTDGTITGDNSTVNNCFFKVNDDGIKVYGDDCTHDNNTMYHQINGAPFQFSWTGQDGDRTHSTNTYIVNSVYKGSLTNTSNTAVVNCREANKGQTIQDHVFDGIYIDNGCHRILGLDATNGTLKNITIRNVELNSGSKANPQNGYSYLDNGVFSNIELCNIYINGNLITGLDNASDKPAQGNLFFKGKAGPMSFCSENGEGDSNSPCGVGDVPAASSNVVDATCNSSNGQIVFSFQDNPNRSHVEFSVNGGTTYLPQVRDNSESYTVESLAPGEFSLFMRWGNNECPQALGSVKVEEGCPDLKPTDINDLIIEQMVCGEVNLTWGDVSGESGYRIRRKELGIPTFTNLTDVPANSTSFTDETVNELTTYVYMVRPLLDGIAVKLSNQPDITTEPCLVTSTTRVKEEGIISVFPNPIQQNLYFSQESSWSLMDLSGKKLKSGVSTLVTLEDLPEGLYLLHLPHQVLRIKKF